MHQVPFVLSHEIEALNDVDMETEAAIEQHFDAVTRVLLHSQNWIRRLQTT